MLLSLCFILCDGDHRVLTVRTHSFPTRRSSGLGVAGAAAADRPAGHVPDAAGRGGAVAGAGGAAGWVCLECEEREGRGGLKSVAACAAPTWGDRKSTRLNSSH